MTIGRLICDEAVAFSAAQMMLKYTQIDLPLSRACGARTDDTERLEQTTGQSSNNENEPRA